MALPVLILAVVDVTVVKLCMAESMSLVFVIVLAFKLVTCLPHITVCSQQPTVRHVRIFSPFIVCFFSFYRKNKIQKFIARRWLQTQTTVLWCPGVQRAQI